MGAVGRAVLAGVGAFQLFDGIVFHKILRIRQIRYGVDLLVYDLVWIGSAVLLVAIGLLVLWRTGPARPRSRSRSRSRNWYTYIRDTSTTETGAGGSQSQSAGCFCCWRWPPV